MTTCGSGDVTDLRAVPPALAVWLACGVGVAGDPPALRAGAGAAALGAVLVVVRGRVPDVARAAALVLVAVAAALAATAVHLEVRAAGPLDELAAQRARVEVVGVARSVPATVAGRFGDRVRVRLHVREVAGRDVSGPASAPVVVLGDVAWSAVRYGATVRATGRLAPVGPGDAAVALLVADPPAHEATPGAVDRAVTRLREALLTVTDGLEPDARGLVPGAAVGDTSRVPADLEGAMRSTGLTHVTAVSGGHVAVLAACVVGATALVGGGRRARAVALGLTLVGFVALVRPEPSVVRAAAMGAVQVAALAVGRPVRALPALACGLAVLCLLDPWLARSYGFALSVLATAAIVVGARPVARFLERRGVPGRAALVLAVPVCAQAACAPVLVLLDPSVSLVAVPANVLAAPAVLPATLGGVLATLVAPVAPGVAQLAVVPAALACRWIAVVARTLAGLPGATVPWPGGVPGAVALAVTSAVGVAVVACLLRWTRPGVRAAVGVLACLALAVHVLAPGVAVRVAGLLPGDWEVVACDVGQGDALVVRTGPGAAVLVDVGPSAGGVGRCLHDLGVRHLDLLVLTHHHADHVGGLEDALRGRTVARALVSPLTPDDVRTAQVLAALRAATPDVQVGVAGMRGRAGHVEWEVLWPDVPAARTVPTGTPGTTLNDASVVLALATPTTQVVALGDLEPPGQSALVRRLRASGALAGVDVVKVAHHGSAHQEPALAGWLAPAVALVSAGADNDYGHPAPATVDLHEGVGALVLSTHACGPVAVRGGPEVRVWARCLDGRTPGRRRVAGCPP